MTTPDLSGLIPLKWKTWVAAISGILAIAVPYVLQLMVYLPAPWPLIIGLAIAVLGALGVYHAPYTPPGTTVVVADTPLPPAVAPQPRTGGIYPPPWPRP